MKKLFYLWLIIVCFLASYLLMAFINYDFNASNWSVNDRGATILIFIILSMVSVLALSFEPRDL